MRRRRFLAIPLALCAARTHAQLRAEPEVAYPDVKPRALEFPRDFGSHPDFRTEWWYVTGWLDGEGVGPLGMQVTFFRSRPGVAEQGASTFVPRQIVFAHAAIADPTLRRLRHDQRAARAYPGLVSAGEQDTDVHLDDWSLVRPGGTYRTHIAARDFALALDFHPTQPLLLQGDRGVSRKGPLPREASYYYSIPQLNVSGTVTLDSRRIDVGGVAWLDHEWSSDYLASDAQGWDWTGIDFDDGSALMAFRIRKANGEALWAGGSYRDPAGMARTFAPGEIRFEPTRSWKSTRTAIVYPVEFTLVAGDLQLQLVPLFDDQELDARASVGTVYWEGATRVQALDGRRGRGYLELTGYGSTLRL